jgi:hypothetical protein
MTPSVAASTSQGRIIRLFVGAKRGVISTPSNSPRWKRFISGYETELYSGKLAAWRRTTFSAMRHGGPRLECVWMNFPEPLTLHDS